MADKRVKGAQPPPLERPKTYQVLRPQKHGALDLTFIADTVYGVQTHYCVGDVTGRRGTHVCTIHDGPCLIHEEREEWSGFVGAWDNVACKRVVLRMAPREYAVLAATLGVDVNWRGKRVRLKPVNNGDGRAITVEVVRTPEVECRIAPHDIELTMCALFGVSRIPSQSAEEAAARKAGG